MELGRDLVGRDHVQNGTSSADDGEIDPLDAVDGVVGDAPPDLEPVDVESDESYALPAPRDPHRISALVGRARDTLAAPRRMVESLARKNAKQRFELFINSFTVLGIIGAIMVLVFLNLSILLCPVPFWIRAFFWSLEGAGLAVFGYWFVISMMRTKSEQDALAQHILRNGAKG